MKIIYFHIGYPKAASTFIQKNIFRGKKQINFINDIAWDDLLKFSQFLFWSKKKAFEDNIKMYTKFLNNISDDKVNAISHEGFTNFSSNPNFNINEIFQRLKYVSQEFNIKFKFIFVIRNQSEYIKSRYAQGHGLTGFYSVNKKFINFSEIRKYFFKQMRTNEEIETFNSFNYYRTFQSLKNIFNENPKILIFEDLKNKPRFFVEDLLKYMKLNNDLPLENIDFSIRNIGKKTNSGEYFRKKNIYHKPYKGTLNIISSLIPFKSYFFKFFSRSIKDKIKILSYKLDRILHWHDKIIFSNEEEIKIKEYYSLGNENLSKLINRNLKSLGY